jgi:hypothetical protein
MRIRNWILISNTNPQKGSIMTDDKKHHENDRETLSDEEMEDVAGGADGGGIRSWVQPLRDPIDQE